MVFRVTFLTLHDPGLVYGLTFLSFGTLKFISKHKMEFELNLFSIVLGHFDSLIYENNSSWVMKSIESHHEVI